MRYLKYIQISFAVVLFGHQWELAFVPFIWARPEWRFQKTWADKKRNLHIFAGPFHFWTMHGLRALIGFDITIDRNHFHGTPLVPKEKS